MTSSAGGHFSGQLASLYLFDVALSAQQVCALHRLGASYAGLFATPDELEAEGGAQGMPPTLLRALYGNEPSSSAAPLRHHVIGAFCAHAHDGPLLFQLAAQSRLFGGGGAQHATMLNV